MPFFKEIPAGVSQAIRDAYMPFNGGLDLETPGWNVKVGHLRDALNYEGAIEGGYQDVLGYERLDGRSSPSAAIYHLLYVTITGSIVAGDTVDGATSGASAYVASVVTDVGDDDYLVLTKLTGNFETGGENIQVSAVTEATSSDPEIQGGASTRKLDAQYKNLAADVYRADIGAVPGEDSVLGVWTLNSVDYAFRNKSGGATAGMYKATASGWTEVALGRELAFTSGGTYVISDGDVIDGATSGAQATVGRVMLESGSWAAGDAAGKLIFASQTGTFQAENLDVGGNLDVATIAADSSAITLDPDGSYEFVNSNFMDPQGNERMYGVDGVNRGFEFDGTSFCPIDTGMATDAPEHVVVHQQSLMYAFGASHQISGLNTAYAWTILTGASEIITDGPIVGYQIQPAAEGNAALLIATVERLHLLYGVTSADFQLTRYRQEIGAYARSLQTLARTIFVHDQGIMDLAAVEMFGNFQHGTLSQKIQTLINAKRTLISASCIVRDKNQYRVFFSDGTAIYVTFEGTKPTAMMPILLEDSVVCMSSVEDGGSEKILFGSDDGFVYQMEKGTSFDGDDITAFLSTHYTNDSIRLEKTFQDSVAVEGKGDGYSELEFTYELNYGDPDTFHSGVEIAALELSNAVTWDLSGAVWDELFWDGQSLKPTSGLDLRGYGENIGFSIRKQSDYMEPVRLTGIHYRYLARKRKT